MSNRIKTKEQEELVVKNLRLVHYLVRKMGIAPSDYDDIVSIGTLGLAKASVKFDSSKGIKFATFAAKCIQNEILMHLRSEKKHSTCEFLEEPISSDKDGNELTLADITPSAESNFVEEVVGIDGFEHIVNIVLNLLKQKDRFIMLYKIAGINQLCMAEKLNISQSYISRIEKRLKKELEFYLNTTQEYKEVFRMAIVGDSYKISFSTKEVKNFNLKFAKFLQDLTSTVTLPNFKVSCNNGRVIILVPAHLESFSFIAEIIKEIDDDYTFTYISDVNVLPANTSVPKETQTDEIKNSVEEIKDDFAVEQNESVNEEEDHNNEIFTELKTTEIEDSAEEIKNDLTVEQDEPVQAEEIISDNLSTSIEVDKSVSKPKEYAKRKASKSDRVREYILSKESFTLTELRLTFRAISTSTINNVVADAVKNGLIKSIAKGKYIVKSVENDNSLVESEKNTDTHGDELTTITERKLSKSQRVREYILSKDSFTMKELRHEFPSVSAATINIVVTQAKQDGLVTLVKRGEYVTKKD